MVRNIAVKGMFAALTLSGALLAAPAAFAQDEQPDNDLPICTEAQKESIQSQVAGLLGISVEELEAAREAHTPIQELVEAAGLDPEDFREQVKAIKEAEGCRRPGRAAGALLRNEEALTAVAELFGMTAEDLNAEIMSGRNVREIAQEQGISMEELREVLSQFRPADGEGRGPRGEHPGARPGGPGEAPEA